MKSNKLMTKTKISNKNKTNKIIRSSNPIFSHLRIKINNKKFHNHKIQIGC